MIRIASAFSYLRPTSQVREDAPVPSRSMDIKALIVEQVSLSSKVDLQSLAAKCLLWVKTSGNQRAHIVCFLSHPTLAARVSTSRSC